MKILVPVDGSDSSVNAVKKAIEIAKKYDFSIKLLTVIPADTIRKQRRTRQLWRQVDGSSILSNKISDEDELTAEMRESAEELLDSILQTVDIGAVCTEKDIVTGEPFEKILETAEKEKFDLIVIGNRGFSNIKSFFLGSVTQRVITQSKCPVLVIHTDSD